MIFPGQAIGYLEEAIAIQREFNNLHSLTYLLETLAAAYAAMRDRGRSLACFDEALAMARELNNLTNIGLGLAIQGMADAYWGQHETALKHFQEAVEIASELAGTRGSFLSGMVNGYFAMARGAAGDFPGAITLYRSWFAKNENAVGAGLARFGLASVLLRTGEIEEAYALARPLISVPYPPAFQAGLAAIAASAGDHATAIGMFKRIIEMTTAGLRTPVCARTINGWSGAACR